MSADGSPRSSSLLFDEQILALRVRLATVLTLPKAILFQQLRFCTYGKDTGKERDLLRDERGRVWAGRAVTEWRLSSFPFWCNDTIADTFAALVREGYVLEAAFPETGKGRTKWYCIADDALTRLDYLAMAQQLRPPALATGSGRRGGRAAALAATPLPRDELFIDSETLFIIPRLAQEIGLNEAIVLQQVYYWLDDRRRPEVRAGERWIANTYGDWREQFPFLSLRTVQRTFLSLEQKGLLKAAHFSRHPEAGGVDHTKWYTIDFAAVRALHTSRSGKHSTKDASAAVALEARVIVPPAAPGANVPDLSPRMCQISESGGTGEGATFPIANAPDFPIGGARFPNPLVPDFRIEGATFPIATLIEITENTAESKELGQEQHPAGTASPEGARPERPVVVLDPVMVSEQLFSRGVTRKVAERLAREVPIATVLRQIEVYDWLREADDDERLTPGRLRLMIEEDWVPPRDFVTAAERERRALAAREAEAARSQRQATAGEWISTRQGGAAAERQLLLEALDLREEDQRVWAAISSSPRRLPPLFAAALFYPPKGAPDLTPPVVIFREREACDRARGAGYAAERREIERRLLERYPALAPRIRDAVRYFAYDELLALRQPEAALMAAADGVSVPSPAR